MREANVTNVSFNKLSGQEYNFAVTLYHDDDGEDGYADSWQVEKLDGTIIGTRILTHAHGTVEFTRSSDIAIPEAIDSVVVRGHDQTHGFGGQVMILSLSNATTIFINQGSEPLNFSTFSFLNYIDDISISEELTVSELASPTTIVNEPESQTDSLDFNFPYIGLVLLFSFALTKFVFKQKN